MKRHNQCNQIKFGGCTFERVSSFLCSVSIINGDNSILEEIKHLFKKGNIAYYAYKILINSTLITENTIMTIYMPLIRPVMTYA
jgi:hypothetical protein